jgi:hypothetical protein
MHAYDRVGQSLSIPGKPIKGSHERAEGCIGTVHTHALASIWGGLILTVLTTGIGSDGIARLAHVQTSAPRWN